MTDNPRYDELDNEFHPEVNAELDAAIAALVQQVRDHQQTIAASAQAIDDAKVQLALLIEQRGANWADESGYARLTKEGRRIDYDTSALDELLTTDPLRYGWLKDYRKFITIPRHVAVK